MNKEPKFRILERWGQVHIQQQTTFLGLRWWSTIKMFYPEGRHEYIDYGKVAEAKAAIDRALSIYRAANAPMVITYYPA